ncbi:FAD/NAD(P)-binding protein [Streptomyces sp. H34-S4]|uniref:FAD/NAD(P)-binding protein n=1 Tax=Streptomyces sp. H34-S4 TaxID=2996463 RepID=UPI002271C5C4|nr:FAD/NAD(P)-binding protein [Streptomyces sp. H34-S4]MCY0936860.1 FAD/NAD(P)-binding protein [Streptomyces sp. H34-S4]
MTHVCVIRAGATGISMVVHLIEAGFTQEIVLVDPRPVGGLAWGDPHLDLISNSASSLHSLFADRPDDFLDYQRQSGQSDVMGFSRRATVGSYCRERLRQYQERATKAGTEVRHVRASVSSIRLQKRASHQVELDDGTAVAASHVVVCSGFRRPGLPHQLTGMSSERGLTLTPYPTPEMLQAIRPGSRVLVLGMRNSAVDSARILVADGHHVTLTSPSAELPAVRSRVEIRPGLLELTRIRELSADDPLIRHKLARITVEALRGISALPLRQQLSTHADPAERLREETGLALADRIPWQDLTINVLEELFPWIPGQSLPAVETLKADYRTVLRRMLGSMSLPNALELVHALDQRQLHLSTRPADTLRPHAQGWEVSWADGAHQRFDHIVCAAGSTSPTFTTPTAASTSAIPRPRPAPSPGSGTTTSYAWENRHCASGPSASTPTCAASCPATSADTPSKPGKSPSTSSSSPRLPAATGFPTPDESCGRSPGRVMAGGMPPRDSGPPGSRAAHRRGLP